MNASACLICGQDRFETVLEFHHPDPYEAAVGVAGADYRRRWARCTACGFHASHYSRDPEVLDGIYEKDYRAAGNSWRGASAEETFAKVVVLPEARSETKQRVRWLKAAAAELAEAGLLAPANEPRAFLDVGGGNGIFAYEFQDEAWRGHIVDPAEAGRFVERSHGIPYVQAFYRAGLFGRRFDLVSLIYALEHLRDPRSVLAAAHADLVPGGGLFVEVPDAAAFRFKDADDDIFNSCHLWMFDPMSLARLFDQSGFDLLALRRLKTARGHYALMALGGRR